MSANLSIYDDRPHNEARIVGFDFFETDLRMDFQFRQNKGCLDEHQTRWTPQESIVRNWANTPSACIVKESS